tara:strand:- start:563 stop:1510 length:948 start_codon:yes stop_codon:yes gene_type:complete
VKIYPEKILTNGIVNLKNKVFVLNGNEETLINKICEVFVDELKKKNFFVEKTDGLKINFDLEKQKKTSLFEEKLIIIHKNPKEIDLSYLESLELGDDFVILSLNNNKNLSILKKISAHKSICLISCYKLMHETKKRLVDIFLSNKSIKLSKSAYWFFLENSSNEYKLLENELIKLMNYGEGEIDTGTLRALTVFENNQGFDMLFFNLLMPRNKILKISRNMILSSSDAYLFLYRVLYFLDIIMQSNNVEDAERNLPRYLFNQKDSFKKIFNMLNKEKIIIMIGLLKKSELLIRKNSSMFLIISQRLLLNLKKQIQ